MATAMPGSAVYPRDHYSSWICVVGYLKICDSLFLCFKKQLFLVPAAWHSANPKLNNNCHCSQLDFRIWTSFLLPVLLPVWDDKHSWVLKLARSDLHNHQLVVLTVCGQNPAILQKRGSFFCSSWTVIYHRKELGSCHPWRLCQDKVTGR